MRKSFVEIQRDHEYCASIPGFVIIGEESVLNEERRRLYYICQELIDHNLNLPIFKREDGRNYIKTRFLGEEIIKLLERLELSRISIGKEKSFNFRIYSPHIELFLKIANAAISEHGAEVDGVGFVSMLPFRPEQYRYIVGAEIDKGIHSLNQLINIFRKAMLSNGMQEAVKSFRRNSKEIYKHAMNAAGQSWGKNCKNLLIRLDWSFRKTYPAKRTRFKSQKDFECQMGLAGKYRKMMLKNLRENFGKDLAFFAWKIECGDIKGIHIHWLIAVNGSKHQDRINVGRKISNDWDNLLGDKSFTFNVNYMRNSEESGLRVIKYNDPDLWSILGFYCDYLTKVDYTLKLRMPKNMRSFGCSKLIQLNPNKPGPKRKFQTIAQDVFEVRGPREVLSKKSEWDWHRLSPRRL